MNDLLSDVIIGLLSGAIFKSRAVVHPAISTVGWANLLGVESNEGFALVGNHCSHAN